MADDDPTYLDEAIKSFERAIQYSKGTDGQAYLKIAQIYRRQKNKVQAIKFYTNSLKFLKPSQHYEAYT